MFYVISKFNSFLIVHLVSEHKNVSYHWCKLGIIKYSVVGRITDESVCFKMFYTYGEID